MRGAAAPGCPRVTNRRTSIRASATPAPRPDSCVRWHKPTGTFLQAPPFARAAARPSECGGIARPEWGSAGAPGLPDVHDLESLAYGFRKGFELELGLFGSGRLRGGVRSRDGVLGTVLGSTCPHT